MDRDQKRFFGSGFLYTDVLMSRRTWTCESDEPRISKNKGSTKEPELMKIWVERQKPR
jgi:hypothetical protein